MMKNFLKLSAIFSVASVVAVEDNDDFFEDDNVETSRDYLRFLTKKYRAMAATESRSENRLPYEERLSKLRMLASHAAGSNASSCGNGTSNNGTTNATTKAATTKAATTKAATTAAPTTQAVVLDVTTEVTVTVSVTLAA